jgi:hypothetical protein
VRSSEVSKLDESQIHFFRAHELMGTIRLTPPRWLQHVQFATCLVWDGTGMAFLSAAFEPEIRSWPLGVMGALSLAVSLWASVRSYSVHVLLDDAALHIRGMIWSRNISRDRITAISDVGQVEYKDARGYGTTTQIMWLMRAVDDDERFVLGRLQRPWREAVAKLRDWADVKDAP